MMNEEQFLELLEKSLYLTPLEKNSLHHNIKNILTTQKDINQAASEITLQIANILLTKKEEIQDNFQNKKEGKVSSIFRRIG